MTGCKCVRERNRRIWREGARHARRSPGRRRAIGEGRTNRFQRAALCPRARERTVPIAPPVRRYREIGRSEDPRRHCTLFLRHTQVATIVVRLEDISSGCHLALLLRGEPSTAFCSLKSKERCFRRRLNRTAARFSGHCPLNCPHQFNAEAGTQNADIHFQDFHSFTLGPWCYLHGFAGQIDSFVRGGCRTQLP